jgi:hypothetical protein
MKDHVFGKFLLSSLILVLILYPPLWLRKGHAISLRICRILLLNKVLWRFCLNRKSTRNCQNGSYLQILGGIEVLSPRQKLEGLLGFYLFKLRGLSVVKPSPVVGMDFSGYIGRFNSF